MIDTRPVSDSSYQVRPANAVSSPSALVSTKTSRIPVSGPTRISVRVRSAVSSSASRTAEPADPGFSNAVLDDSSADNMTVSSTRTEFSKEIVTDSRCVVSFLFVMVTSTSLLVPPNPNVHPPSVAILRPDSWRAFLRYRDMGFDLGNYVSLNTCVSRGFVTLLAESMPYVLHPGGLEVLRRLLWLGLGHASIRS